MITRVLQKVCDTEYVSDMIHDVQCETFQVLPVESCYAINWRFYKYFFEEEFLNETMERLNESIIAHVWNKISSKITLSLDSNVAYIKLAKKFCPKVVQASKFF